MVIIVSVKVDLFILVKGKDINAHTRLSATPLNI